MRSSTRQPTDGAALTKPEDHGGHIGSAAPGTRLPTRGLLRIDEAAEWLRLSKRKTYELVSRGELPSVHIGRSPECPGELRGAAYRACDVKGPAYDSANARQRDANPRYSRCKTGPLFHRCTADAASAQHAGRRAEAAPSASSTPHGRESRHCVWHARFGQG
jgi:excisionase family DNA binding protein